MERIHLETAGGDRSEITIARDVLSRDPVEVLLPERADRGAVALLAQPSTVSLARQLASGLSETGLIANVRVLPDGEDAKRLAVVEACAEWLNEVGLTRHDTIVGVGGGALTDVAGFVAATYLRGIEASLVPTTLLAAVDAAIGGKTGVNVEGKNLVGTFRMPARVVVDLSLLERLPREHRQDGAAEALKAGLIGDPDIVALYEEHGAEAPLDLIVPAAVRVKADVVSEDPTEQGRRAVLNYGHTIGHAVEVAGSLPHGHAVAIGMVAAGAASRLVTGFAEEGRQRDVIEKIGLPTEAPNLSKAEVSKLIGLDKKRTRRGPRMVLLTRVGAAVVQPVDEATVDLALAAAGIG